MRPSLKKLAPALLLGSALLSAGSVTAAAVPAAPAPTAVADITIPNYGFTGDIYTWGRGKGRAHSTNTGVQPGDIVLYGTGPQNTSTSVHTGVVVAVGNGKITTVEGNASNAVRKFGPFDPTRAKAAGRPGNIYGWVAAQ
ncbi:CHAP domain-containing protein [Streptomyces sp. SID13031]|uniref:CHAP domain-containing protein n=1 Tax=Streptomyces sp. SID13031 TaxID=2706046 RepID=UPI0013CA437B|nr:CHAP domain-containing protein [Streptomyces sp. SID13031]NEA34829.1 CHAP domain-containing protein [Streptomyces sp. SID13031]